MSAISLRTVQKFACALSAFALTTGTMLVTTATPSEAATPATTHEWIEHAEAELGKKLYYPFDALRKDHQGVVKISATVTPEGKLENVSIARSAGLKTLDRAALRAVSKLENLPPLPEAQGSRDVILHVGFGIARSPSQEAAIETALRKQPATSFAMAK